MVGPCVENPVLQEKFQDLLERVQVYTLHGIWDATIRSKRAYTGTWEKYQNLSIL
jgi:hypothetical protein